jgi:hypothetical protein
MSVTVEPFNPGGLNLKPTTHNFIAYNDAIKPDIGLTLTERYGSETLYGLLAMVGQSRPTGNIEYSHHEEKRMMPKIKATSPGGAAGASVTLTLDASASVDVSNQLPYDTGATVKQTGVPVRPNDTIQIKPASGIVSQGLYINAIVLTVNAGAGTFVAAPLDPLKSIPVIGSADEIIIYGNAHGEGSARNTSVDSEIQKYTNNTQIIKDSYNISGTGDAEILWFKVTDQNGRSSPFWTLRGEKQLYQRFHNYKELTMLIGEQMTNDVIANAAAEGEPNKTTRGLIPDILAGGNVLNYTSIAGLTIADMKAMVKTLDKQKGSKENLLEAGIDLSLQIDDEWGDHLKNGAISYGNFNFTAEKAINLQFSSFQIGNYRFHKKTYDAFNDNQTLGAQGYGYAYEGMVIPMNNDNIDAKSQTAIPSLSVRYLNSSKGVSRETQTTARNMFLINGTDRFEFDYQGECGFEAFALNRFFYIKRAS